MVFKHEIEANSILPKSGLKHLVAVTPSNINNIYVHIGLNRNQIFKFYLNKADTFK